MAGACQGARRASCALFPCQSIRHLCSVPHSLPPYALSAPSFPFPHLASLAGRAPIGGAREVALACFVAARLAADCMGEPLEAGGLARSARAAGAKGWLGTLALPALIRGPLLRCLESTADSPPSTVGRALAELALAGATFLDPASIAELESLALILQG